MKILAIFAYQKDTEIKFMIDEQADDVELEMIIEMQRKAVA